MTADGLRVLVVPASYFANDRVVGGGERYATEYARALARHTPTTLALFDKEAKREVVDGLEVRTFAVRSVDPLHFAPVTFESWRAFGEYDVIHSMVFPMPITDVLAVSARVRRQTLVLTDVGGGGSCFSTYLHRIHPRVDLNRMADGLAVLSEYGLRFFDGWNHPKVVLYGGAHLEDFPPSSAADGTYALFVGRLLEHKGVLPLIEAIDSETPLHVIGRPYDPAYLARLREAARGKQVRFILDADDDALRREYAGARLVLQPSVPVDVPERDKSELLGLVALEGMASAKPVIVTRTTSLGELVVDGETGFVVPPFDREALGERIGRLMRDPALADRMGAAGRARVEERFTWDGVALRGLEFYRRLRDGRA